ncbi:hypothetical protein CcaverHIS631_0500500 [Cutaneotrichosporon cavernicola]|nr:hypothetical protein CcaverHIS631_0500500 [Cutaneotrichosporon cavernicola]BEJ07964.1 hypothetical protein CcaverHIS641_0500490 [Cutaneotrichosporon cavernicola]
MQAHNPAVVLDVSAFPHIVDRVVFAAPVDVLASFRLVSRRFRALVDNLTTSHLILEGVSTTVFPAAVLHNGERLMMRHSDPTPTAGSIWPAHTALAFTRVLDLRGTLPGAALKLPLQLHTLRLYEYYAAALGPDARKTLIWGPPSYPSARRIVVFSTFEQCAHVKHRPQILYYPPSVREVVLNLKLPGVGRKWGRLDVPGAPPELEHVTVILTPSLQPNPASLSLGEDPPLDEDELDSPRTRAVEDLVAVIRRLGAPATVIGSEHLDRKLVERGLLVSLREVGVALRRVDEVRKEIGDREWDVLTCEAPLPSEKWISRPR